MIAGARFVNPEEAIEDALAIAWRNAGTLVRDRQYRLAITPVNANEDGSASPAVFDQPTVLFMCPLGRA